MKTFKSLEMALEGVFDSPFSKLPKVLQQRVNEDFYPWPWEKMDADQRRNRAQTWDFQNDPSTIELRDGINDLTAIDSSGYSLDEVKRLRGDYPGEPLREVTKPAELPALEWASSPEFEVRKGALPVADTTPETQAAAVVTAVDTPSTKMVDRGWTLKRAALIAKHQHQWPTITRDLQDASDNQLSRDAKATGHGDWFEADALKWAEQRGKLTKASIEAMPVKATPFTGLTHRIKG